MSVSRRFGEIDDIGKRKRRTDISDGGRNANLDA